MYSVLLVEDEKIELETLRDYVDWQKVGIDKVYTARGGRSALACISENEPDIIITDIQMPGMSGTELAQLVREEGRACKIVFLTGYDKFEYAKAAIQVHAEEYLLKPFQVEEVESLVAKILDQIKQEQLARETERLAIGRIIEKVCTGQKVDADNRLLEKAAQMTFCLLGFYGTTSGQQQTIHAMPEVIHSFLLDSLYIVLLPTSIPAQTVARSWLNEWQQDVRVIAMKTKTAFSELADKCAALLSHREALFWGNKKAFLFAEDLSEQPRKAVKDPSTQCVALLLRAITEGNEEQAIRDTKEILAAFRFTGKDACLQAAYRLHLRVRNRVREDGDGVFDGAGTQILHSTTFTELEAIMTEYVRCCCQPYQNGSDRQFASRIKHYIAGHYAEPCSAENIAEEMNLSPNYLRRRFKAATGQTILEHLTEVRLNQAAELLKTSQFKVKDVSIRVGYENISYFTQLFSKKFGVTPNEYKKMV